MPENLHKTGNLEGRYAPGNILEVVTGVAMVTLSNYTSHLAAMPLDEAFEDTRWTPPGEAKD